MGSSSNVGRWSASLTILAWIWSMGAVANAAENGDPFLRPAMVPAPAHNQPNAPRVELGRALFFDPRLSGSNWISCATCHNPALGWSDALPTAIGHNGKVLSRATPTILNTAYVEPLMWDGRKTSLEDQAMGPVESSDEMHQDPEALMAKLRSIEGYRLMFERAYPGEGINKDTVGKAIASFERTIVSTDAPFDHWRKGNQRVVSESVKRGFQLFTQKANCAVCHSGFNFTDNSFHNIGVVDVAEADLGRFNVKRLPSMRGAFKTPTLRDISLTAPYMHNGIYKTLEEVIDHYDRGGDAVDNLSKEMKPLQLTAQEKRDLVAFMESLTGVSQPVQVPMLPSGVTADVPRPQKVAIR
jgi:cytochrome c peroxidase